MILRLSIIATSFAFLLVSNSAWGKGGDWSLGFLLGQTSSDQTDINTLVSRANTREGGISTSELGGAWEAAGYIGVRVMGSFLELQFRPSYFFHSEDGTGTSGTFEYSVDAFTIFPMARFYMLESDMVKFFSQIGLGYGIVTGEIKEGDQKLEFSGSQSGYLAGLGAQFCFYGGAHCVNLEGNVRFMTINRVKADSVSGANSNGTFDGSGSGASLSQALKGQEVEIDGRDLEISMGGLQFLAGYVFFF